MAADTALTTLGESQKLDFLESAFGQDHFLSDDQDRKVQEAVVKLFLKNDIGITFAGRYDLAIKIIKAFYQKVSEGMSVLESLRYAIFLNSPFPNGQSVQLAIGYFDGESKLVSFNSQGNLRIREDESLVQLGNALPIHRQLTERWVNDISGNSEWTSELQLSSMLGVLQSYNLFSPQMDRGIGGAFGGLYVDAAGGKWQPDILFVEYGGPREKLVSTCFRHDRLLISSPIIGQSRCLLTYIPPASEQFLVSQSLKAVSKARMLERRAEYQYAVILGVNAITLTILEMKRQKAHDLFRIQTGTGPRGDWTKLTLLPELTHVINRDDGGFMVIPYQTPRKERIPEERIKRKDVSYN